MDLKIVGHRIKAARDARNLSQEDLAELVSLSPTHISVLERGTKTMRLDKFIAIANALEVSADFLLVDVVDYSTIGATNELLEKLNKLKPEERRRILRVLQALIED